MGGNGIRRQALILDFGGVVTTQFLGLVGSYCVNRGLAPDSVMWRLRSDNALRATLADAECGRVTQGEFEIALGHALGVDGRGFIREIGEGLRPSKPVIDLVGRARAAGCLVSVLSNSFGSGGYDLYEGYDLDRLFDAVVISDRVGMRKPDEDIYRLMVKKLGVSPTDCVFADDSAVNLPPAEALGMAVVHFTDVDAGITEIETLLGLA